MSSAELLAILPVFLLLTRSPKETVSPKITSEKKNGRGGGVSPRRRTEPPGGAGGERPLGGATAPLQRPCPPPAPGGPLAAAPPPRGRSPSALQPQAPGWRGWAATPVFPCLPPELPQPGGVQSWLPFGARLRDALSRKPCFARRRLAGRLPGKPSSHHGGQEEGEGGKDRITSVIKLAFLRSCPL